MAKQKYRIENWSEYNNALKQRGSLTFWIEEGFEDTWYAGSSGLTKRGRPFFYSDTCIKVLATLRHMYQLTLRQLEGFVRSLFGLLKIDLPVPEFSRLSRRFANSLADIPYPSLNRNIDFVLDSTGLKIHGEHEWIKPKQGRAYKRKVWRKLHIGIDGEGVVRASTMTTHKVNDRACFSPLIDPLDVDYIYDVLADAGYDSHAAYHYCGKKNIRPLIPPPHNAKLSKRKDASLQRNDTIAYLKEKGIHAWKKTYNYGRRNRVENTFFRLKILFGRHLVSRTWSNQAKECMLYSSQ
jgi:transposase